MATTSLSSRKRETLFIQILEGLCAEEAAFLVSVVNKRLNNDYKGFTANLVKDAFNWDENFIKKEARDLLTLYNFSMQTLRNGGFYIMNEEDDLPLSKDTVPYEQLPITDEESMEIFL